MIDKIKKALTEKIEVRKVTAVAVGVVAGYMIYRLGHYEVICSIQQEFLKHMSEQLKEKALS